MNTLLINISRKQALTYAVFLVLYEFTTYIANDMIMPAMLKVVSSFHGPESAIALSLTAYVAGGASLQLLLGPLSDRYGRRPVMLWGAFFFLLCTVAIACSHSMGQFLVARFFQGMGLCFIGVIGYATLQEIFSEMDAVRLIAIMANVSIMAPLIGPLFGAAFIYYYSWRWIFAMIAIGAFLAFWGLWQFMPESVGQLKYDGNKIERVELSMVTILNNYRALFLNPIFLLGSMALGLVYLPCMSWIALSPVIIVKEAHLTILQYSLWQIPVFGAYILGNVFLHRLTRRWSLKKMIFFGSYFVGFSMILIYAFPLLRGSHFAWLMPGLIAYFFGIGILCAPLGRFILFSTGISKGTASALMSMLSMLIQAIGIEVANLMYTSHNNINFEHYCFLSVLAYFICLRGCFLKTQKTA